MVNGHTLTAAEEAVLSAMNGSTAPALAGLNRPQYRRELRTRYAGNCIVIELDKRGCRRYKRRKKPVFPPLPVFLDGIQAAFNAAFPETLTVTHIRDCGNYIKLYIVYIEGE